MKKYVTRNNSGGGSGALSALLRKRQSRGRKKVFDLVDALGSMITSYEDRDVPTAGDLEQVVQSLEAQADRYNNNNNNRYNHNNNHNIATNNYNDYDNDEYYENDDINEEQGVSKNTRLKSGKLPNKSAKHDYIYDKDDIDDEKTNKRVRYDRELINETITQREKERAREHDVQKPYNGETARGNNNDGGGGGLIHSPQYTLNSERVYTIFDAIIRTYGEYSREVGTAFVDTALKLTNRQIDSLACVKMLQTLFRDSPEVVHLFFDLIQSEPGAENVDDGVDFTKNLTVDERLLFGQKHDPRHKPQKYPSHAYPPNPAHQQTLPTFHQPPQMNSQQARERHEVVRFLSDIKEALDFASYQRFQDYMLELRVIYKDKRYNFLEMKMGQVFSLLGNRNDLKLQLERLFPVTKISHSGDAYAYQQEFNPQMHMLGYDQMRMQFPGVPQFQSDLPRPPLGHPLYPPHMAMPSMPSMSMPSMPSMQSMQMPSMYPGMPYHPNMGLPPQVQGMGFSMPGNMDYLKFK